MSKRLLVAVSGAALILSSCSSTGSSADQSCDQAFVATVLEPASQSAREIVIDCDLELSASNTVTKRLIFEAGRVSLQCNGAVLDGGQNTVNKGRDMIEVRSKLGSDGKYSRPENVTVGGCNVIGSIRVWGMAKNGEGEALRDSSHSDGHTIRTRDNAPRAVTLIGLNITATGRIPVYFAPGVTDSALRDSNLGGRSDSVAVYLDAESANNEIRGNEFHTDVSREVMAIDGSSDNVIVNNWFSSLNTGGIYLYRNCGEGGTVRHNAPTGNDIVNNVFFYNKYRGPKPSVFMGARDGNRNYCGKDDGFPFGSSESNLDFAADNAVVQNQIFKRAIAEMVLEGGSTNGPNRIQDNTVVTSADDRPAVCVLRDGDSVDVVAHGNTVQVAVNPNIFAVLRKCSDGRLEATPEVFDAGD